MFALQVWRVELRNMTSRILSSIVADTVVGTWGPRAYVGSSRCGYLLVVGQNGWWQIGLDMKGSEAAYLRSVGASTLALSRREPVLYLTAPDSDPMFSLDLSAIRSSPPPNKNVSLHAPSLNTLSVQEEQELSFNAEPSLRS
jgi:hypothetical protein